MAALTGLVILNNRENKTRGDCSTSEAACAYRVCSSFQLQGILLICEREKIGKCV